MKVILRQGNPINLTGGGGSTSMDYPPVAYKYSELVVEQPHVVQPVVPGSGGGAGGGGGGSALLPRLLPSQSSFESSDPQHGAAPFSMVL